MQRQQLHTLPTTCLPGFAPLTPPGGACRINAPWGTEDKPVEVTSSFTSRVVGVPGELHDKESLGAAPARHLGCTQRAGLEGRGLCQDELQAAVFMHCCETA